MQELVRSRAEWGEAIVILEGDRSFSRSLTSEQQIAYRRYLCPVIFLYCIQYPLLFPLLASDLRFYQREGFSANYIEKRNNLEIQKKLSTLLVVMCSMCLLGTVRYVCSFVCDAILQESQLRRCCCHRRRQGQKAIVQKTYNTRDSLVVTDPTLCR